MNDEEIATIAAKLDKETQSTNCVAKFVQHETDSDVSRIVATRGAYLKLASFCLRAASSASEEELEAIGDEMGGLWHEDSQIYVNWLERSETLQIPDLVAPEVTLKDKIFGALASIGCFVFLIAIIGFIGVGISTVASNWFT